MTLEGLRRRSLGSERVFLQRTGTRSFGVSSWSTQVPKVESRCATGDPSLYTVYESPTVTRSERSSDRSGSGSRPFRVTHRPPKTPHPPRDPDGTGVLSTTVGRHLSGRVWGCPTGRSWVVSPSRPSARQRRPSLEETLRPTCTLRPGSSRVSTSYGCRAAWTCRSREWGAYRFETCIRFILESSTRSMFTLTPLLHPTPVRVPRDTLQWTGVSRSMSVGPGSPTRGLLRRTRPS